MKTRDMQVIAKGFSALAWGDYSFFTNKQTGETLPREEARTKMEDWFINSWNDDDYNYINRENIKFNYDRIGKWVTIKGTAKTGAKFEIRITAPDMITMNGIKINFNP